eukprot:9157912-Pyramimonas_sp.AAC.1
MNLVSPQLIGNFLGSNSNVTISKLAIAFVTTVRDSPTARVVESPTTFRARHGGVYTAKGPRRRHQLRNSICCTTSRHNRSARTVRMTDSAGPSRPPCRARRAVEATQHLEQGTVEAVMLRSFRAASLSC